MAAGFLRDLHPLTGEPRLQPIWFVGSGHPPTDLELCATSCL